MTIKAELVCWASAVAALALFIMGLLTYAVVQLAQ